VTDDRPEGAPGRAADPTAPAATGAAPRRAAALTPGELARLLGDGWDAGPATAGPTPGAADASAAGAPPVAEALAGPPTAAAVWAALESVPDPEVPVISVVELGVVRDVALGAAGQVTVTITPTYSGCPAMHEIERDVAAALAARGWAAEVRTTYTPAWTTDWMTDAAREKLRAYGIAPPGAAGPALVPLTRRGRAGAAAPVPASVPCPRCGAADTALRSAFGATACKALYACNACGEPFEAFKAV
jgi:ring-1,2-phenylacetyl-CoA epoxidase subunit PaaD